MRTQSHTSVKLFQRCPKRYHYRYHRRLEPIEKPPQLVRGIRYHKLFEELYTGELEVESMTDDELIFMERYTNHWQEEDATWTILGVEPELEMELPSGRKLQFKPDLVIEVNGEVWVVDHKTVKDIPNEYDPYNMTDFQHLWYLEGVAQWLGRIPAGFMFNYTRSKVPTMPRLTKQGKIAYLGTIDTTPEILRAFAEENGLDGDKDVADRLMILEHTPSRYYQRHWLPLNAHAVHAAIYDAEAILDQMEYAETTPDGHPRHVMPGWAGSQACSRCEFQGICNLEMLGMEVDIEVLGLKRRDRRS